MAPAPRGALVYASLIHLPPRAFEELSRPATGVIALRLARTAVLVNYVLMSSEGRIGKRLDFDLWMGSKDAAHQLGLDIGLVPHV